MYLLPGGTAGNSWWWCAARFSKSWPYFRPKNFIFHTRFQTWRWSQKAALITCLHKTEIMSSLLRLKPQQIDFLKSFRILHFLIHMELKQRTFINNRSFFVNHTRFQTSLFQALRWWGRRESKRHLSILEPGTG